MTVHTLIAPKAAPDAAQGFEAELGLDIRAWLQEASTLLHNRAEGDSNDQAALALALAVAEAQKIISEQQQRIEALEQLSHTDELTGVLNRRGFTLEIDRKILEAARRNKPGAIIFVDLDGFKAINDTHGHAAGDAVLKAVADFLLEMVRGGDAVGRLGGDEFAVMLAGVAPQKAERRADEIRQALEAVEVDWNGVALPVRASMGAVSFDGGADAEDIVARADQAMYRAKRARKSNPA